MGGVFQTLAATLALGLVVGGHAKADPAPPAEPALCPEATIYQVLIHSYWEENCYIIAGKTGQAVVFDPGDTMDMTNAAMSQYRSTGDGALLIYRTLEQYHLTLKYMILSHGHLDHISATGFLKQKTGATVMMGAGDVDKYGYPKDAHMFPAGEIAKVDKTLADGEIVSLDGMSFRVILTPGHSPGGLCLYTSQNGRPLLFSGDTLLYHSLGRWNFHDGSGDRVLLFKSIKERLFTLPPETYVFPGHYGPTTIGEEKANNPFVGDNAQPWPDDTTTPPTTIMPTTTVG